MYVVIKFTKWSIAKPYATVRLPFRAIFKLFFTHVTCQIQI